MFIGEWNKSVILTYIGMAFAVLGIYCAHENMIYKAFCCLIVAGVCDLFDGAVARKCKRNENQKLFGIQLDSLVDVMSFLALPITICMGIGMNKWYHMLILIAFAICGIARLAFFNVVSESSDGPVSYYRGLPVTYTALILSMVYLLSFLLEESIIIWIMSATVLVIAFMNIFDFKVKKPRGSAYPCFALLAIVMLVVYLSN